MIARMWRGSATIANAAAHAHDFKTKFAPHLKDIPGHRGAYVTHAACTNCPMQCLIATRSPCGGGHMQRLVARFRHGHAVE
jgi:hypothetical protein